MHSHSSLDSIGRTFVFKLTARCNLACDYCYMFSRVDRSFRQRPARMSLDVAAAALARVAEHAKRTHLNNVTVALHGGEPLLAGKPWMTEFLQLVEDVRSSGLGVYTAVQTNGTLLDSDWLSLFAEHDVQVGISLDGPAEWNDLHRFDHAGRGSYQKVRRALDLLVSDANAPRWGVLVVADPDYSSVAIYSHLRSIGVRNMDFLWPDFHHDDPPPWPASSLGHYYIELFDAWYREADAAVRIRWFESVLMLFAGARSGIDSVGPQKFTDIMIESDGELQPLDSLRICGDAFTSTGINVRDSSVATLYMHPLYQECIEADERVPEECLSCQVRDICGGGLMTHRWGRGNRFLNPSVHSSSIRAVLEHIRSVVSRDAPFLLVEKGAPTET